MLAQVRPILNTESMLYFVTRQVLDRPIATFAARQPCAYQVAAPNGSIAEGADQTRKRNRKAVRDDRWNEVPISNYRRLDEWRGLITANCRRKRTAVEL